MKKQTKPASTADAPREYWLNVNSCTVFVNSDVTAKTLSGKTGWILVREVKP